MYFYFLEKRDVKTDFCHGKKEMESAAAVLANEKCQLAYQSSFSRQPNVHHLNTAPVLVPLTTDCWHLKTQGMAGLLCLSNRLLRLTLNDKEGY